MKLRLASDQTRKLAAALERAGHDETGGQLFGEQLAPSEFHITELTVHSRRGSFARFVVDLVQAARDALRFFERTGHRYTRFNYIGEWHSHPSFDVRPSVTDVETMQRLVRDPEFRGHFAVLVIVRLNGTHVAHGAWLFDPRGGPWAVDLEVER